MYIWILTICVGIRINASKLEIKAESIALTSEEMCKQVSRNFKKRLDEDKKYHIFKNKCDKQFLRK